MDNFYLKTYGCKLNQYESQLIRENLLKRGLLETSKARDCDYVVVNSCAVTEKSVQELKRFIRLIIGEHPKAKIIAAGCVLDLYPEELAGFPIFKYFKNSQKQEIAASLSYIKENPLTKVSFFKSNTRAFVKIQDGCDNRCSYCCVWIARGRAISRNPLEVIAEVKGLLENGFKEIVLCGICMGSFGKDIGLTIVELLHGIEKLDFDFRLRLSSIEPQDINTDFIAYFNKSGKIVPHLHIPLQSGSDRVLKAMNRKYSVDFYKDVVMKLKEKPNFEFSTDVMVGFPNEDARDFQKTEDFLSSLIPIKTHIFTFSPRPKTSAFDFKKEAKGSLISERRKTLQALCHKLVLSKLSGHIGGDFKVLFERELNGLWIGYSENYIRIAYRCHENLKNKFRLLKAVELDKQKEMLIAKMH